MQESIKKADILIEAIPYIQAFRGKVIVAKYGGSALDNLPVMRSILQDLVFLSTVGIRAVLVHGGGQEITRALAALGRPTTFIDGMRVTDRHAIRVVAKALTDVNRRLVEEIRRLNGEAEGMVPSRRVIAALPHPRAAQLGFVGAVSLVHTGPLRMAFKRHAIPVVCPVGADGRQLYNINADDVASHVAAHLRAEKLVLLTNVRGILRDARDETSLLSHLAVREAKALIGRGVIQSGMIPKVRACMAALRAGVKKTHIIDAAFPHAMLLEIFTTQGIGTEIVR